MKKIWFLDIKGHLKGPYSVKDLKNDRRVTPDTLVWREGFVHSVPIRNVPELKEVFADKKESYNGSPAERGGAKQLNDLMIMEMSQEPPFLMWVMLLLILFLLAWYLHRH